ncbi:hypothetical protein ACFB49_21040 [Sphingomonas sp. DBB INV C78]|uniref:hypothetical protein n=1 Tax=Sphingomonas sp. DBB INV C78 TaxID=3349434 RepID=UPI0036D20C27
MTRRLALFLMYLLALTLGAGSIAHAMEPITCPGSGSEISIGHNDFFENDGDSDKSLPHAHGGCHGHHLSTTPQAMAPAPYFLTADLLPPNQPAGLVASGADPALRPPIA